MPVTKRPTSLSLSLPRSLSRPAPDWVGRVPSARRILLPGERRGVSERMDLFLRICLRRLTSVVAGILR